MNALYTKKEYDLARGIDELPHRCILCNKIFYHQKKYIKKQKKLYNKGVNFCSQKCSSESKITKKKVKCKQCNKIFEKIPSQIKKTKNNFCSSSCAATYNNNHKKYGIRRSKLEKWLEDKLTKLYPNIEFHFNRKDKINSELDIYIPSLNLAFELNGIFHYEPIYGKERLNKIQTNDKRKFQACFENNIELCIIDSSQLKYFKEKNCTKYLDIITTIINNKSKNN